MTPEPQESHSSPLIFISASEPSGDLHGASLIRAVRRIEPAARFVGVAGPMMREAGCETLYDMTVHAAMHLNVFKRIPQGLAMLRRCRQAFDQRRFDVAIVIDSPMVNIPVSKHAHRAGVPVLYYIAPQLWAWGKWRIRRVRARVNRMAVILGFEEKYFRDRGIDADYVGHPLFDTLARRTLDPSHIAAIKAKGQPVIAIMPGSRAHIVREILTGQLEVAAAIARRFPGTHVCVSVANDRVEPTVSRLVSAADLSHSLHRGQNGEVLSACDLALVASGTATIETAYYHTPMIVMYNAPPLGWHTFGRWVVHLKHLSLINILADREVVPEFMPYYRSTAPIIDKALGLLESPERLGQMRSELASVIDPLVKTGAADNTAAIVMEMINHRAGE